MKLKDLLNHIAAYSAIDSIEIRYDLIPIDSMLFPECLCKPRGDYNGYANCRLNSFAILGNVLRVNIDCPDLEDPEKARIVVRYRYNSQGRISSPGMPQEFRCATKRQADHVLAYIKSKSDTHVLLGITQPK